MAYCYIIMKTLVIFDLDGTLINSIADLAAATNHALQSMGYSTHATQSYYNMVGNGITKLLERALPDEARTTRIIEAMRVHFKEYYDQHLYDQSTPYPGIIELLQELTARNIGVAVASNKYQSAVEKIIEHFFGEIPWKAVFGHIDGVPVKPDPSIIFEVLSKYPTPKNDVLYVGDSNIDIETARRACVDNCGVTWGFRTRQELVNAYAQHIVNNPDDILSLL